MIENVERRGEMRTMNVWLGGLFGISTFTRTYFPP
jgi:hypothetical protein